MSKNGIKNLKPLLILLYLTGYGKVKNSNIRINKFNRINRTNRLIYFDRENIISYSFSALGRGKENL